MSVIPSSSQSCVRSGCSGAATLAFAVVMRTSIALVLLVLASAPLSAKPPGLVVKTGESWVFAIRGGQPVKARKVAATAKAGAGQVIVTVRSMMGTTMTITSNSPVAYTYQAELIGKGKPIPIRSCTLPANNQLSFEHWPQQADGVRLSNFKVATKDGACP